MEVVLYKTDSSLVLLCKFGGHWPASYICYDCTILSVCTLHYMAWFLCFRFLELWLCIVV